MHAWQFFELAAKLKPLIERPRSGGQKLGKAPHHDYSHRLYFALKWLNDGNFHCTREIETGWSKLSVHRDLEHVLVAIVEGLDDQLSWPNEERRRELADQYPGIFKGCIGIGDVKEIAIDKPKDLVKERRSFNGKKKINSFHLFTVMDHSGRFIFARVSLGGNDRECYMGSPLYLQEGKYFSDGQFVAADGGFEGEGRFCCSYKNPGNDVHKRVFNLAWREVRMGVENSYCRLCQWFPLLGNNKKRLNYSENIIFLAVQASVRLHNYIMNTEKLSYAAYESCELHYSNYF
jgi:hypothetical protein